MADWRLNRLLARGYSTYSPLRKTRGGITWIKASAKWTNVNHWSHYHIWCLWPPAMPKQSHSNINTSTNILPLSLSFKHTHTPCTLCPGQRQAGCDGKGHKKHRYYFHKSGLCILDPWVRASDRIMLIHWSHRDQITLMQRCTIPCWEMTGGLRVKSIHSL